MKIKKCVVLLTIIYSLFHFSPQVVGATVSEENEAIVYSDQEETIESSKVEEVEQSDQKIDRIDEDQVTEESEGIDSDHLHNDNPVQESGDEDEYGDDIDMEKEAIEPEKKEPHPLSKGDSHEDVKELKVNLGKLGFSVPGKGTSLFGKNTEKQVKEFQAYYNLEVTGIVYDETITKIESLLSSPFQSGKRHESTVQLKRDLAKLGFRVPGKGTNLYGIDTTKRVKEFQAYYGLKVNGIADDITLVRIQELLEAPLGKGMYRADVVTLKKNLGEIGFSVPGKGTTLFGKNTEKKVKEFQSYYNLEVTGIVYIETLTKIESLLSSPFQSGKRHESTVQLKRDLAKLGFRVPGKGTTLYGKDTTKKVKKFQAYYGLKVNGIADERTLAKIEELLEAPLSKGMYREDVKILKRNLGKLGFPVPGKGTTLYGKNTEKKVKEFQSYYNFEVTGIVYDSTLAKIEEVSSSSFQSGKRHNQTIQLKKDLATLGFRVPGNGTTLYGKDTTKKVEEFQIYYGLKVNGIADPITLKQIDDILSGPFQIGGRDDRTVLLKKDLARLGFRVPGNGTTLYGKNTKKKIREFQGYYGLKISGIADQVTFKKIEGILKSPLQKGKRHKSTIQLKEDLATLGYTVSKKPTTLYGSKTEKEMRSFQKDYGLPVSGIADSITLKKIDSLIVKVFIDPGHGGKDPGAKGKGLKEKNVALDIALKAAEVLSKKYLGVSINLSRTVDKFIELEDRSKMANKWGADYFVSIHNNAHTGKANGFESFIHNGKVSQETKDKQKKIHKDLIKKLGVTDRGMKKANFNVLRNTTMPAMLIEYLFIDNPKENALLQDKKYRSWLGEITADAIANAFSLKKR